MIDCQIEELPAQTAAYANPDLPELKEEDEAAGKPSSSSRWRKKYHGENVAKALETLAAYGEASSEMNNVLTEINFQQLTVFDRSSADGWAFEAIDQKIESVKPKKPSEQSQLVYLSFNGTVCSEDEVANATLLKRDTRGFKSLYEDYSPVNKSSCSEEFITHACPVKADDDSQIEHCKPFPQPSFLSEMYAALKNAAEKRANRQLVTRAVEQDLKTDREH